MSEIRALIVGLGVMGRTHLATLQSRAGVCVVGVVRSSGQPIGDGLPVRTELVTALHELQPNLAVISTPHHLHFEQARLCLEHGCHVLVEKPMTLHYRESNDLVDLSRRRGLLLVVGLQRRHEGLCSVFRDLSSTGALGAIQFVHGFFAHRMSAEILRGWRTEPAIAGAGILDDSAVHLVDLMLYFAGGNVRSLQGHVLEGAGVALPHSFAVVIEMDNGVIASASGSYLSPAHTVQEEMSILGVGGSLFARRFCKTWNTEPPAVFYKSADGSILREFDLRQLPMGRTLPLVVMLDVLQGAAARETLFTEAQHTLETHRAIELLRKLPRSLAQR